MLDSRGLIHTPKVVRVTALTMLITTLIVSIGVTVYFTLRDNPADPKYPDWVLVGMSLIHLALSGLAIATVLFYSEREVNTETLIRKTEDFLVESVPMTLQRVTASYGLRQTPSQVERLGRSDIFGAAYKIMSGQHTLRVWIGLNVSRLLVIYWVRIPDDADAQAFCVELQETVRFTFGGAERVGFHTYFEVARSDNGEPVVSIWSTADSGHNLLTEPAQRLFWLQDIAMMTESFWRTSIRQGITLSSSEPSPL